MNFPSSESIDRFYAALLSLKTPEECQAFFEDLCTIREVQIMAQRLEVAQLLIDGRNYQEIMGMTNVSTATISRVSKFLNYGDGGFRLALSRISGKDGENTGDTAQEKA